MVEYIRLPKDMAERQQKLAGQMMKRMEDNKVRAQKKREELALRGIKTATVPMHDALARVFREAVLPISDMPLEEAMKIIEGIGKLVRGADGVVMAGESARAIELVSAEEVVKAISKADQEADEGTSKVVHMSRRKSAKRGAPVEEQHEVVDTDDDHAGYKEEAI